MSVYGRKSIWSAAFLVTLFILFFTTYYLRLDNVVGMFRDDAWYALLAKALATGQGYTLINSPNGGIVPIYPPFYSSVLSLVFLMSPQFPENIFFLKSVSIVAMLIASILSYFYFITRDCSKVVAIVLAAVVGFSPGLVFIATSSLMSECVYMVIQLGSVILIHKSTQTLNSHRSNLFLAFGGFFLSLAFLTRSVALAFLVAAIINFVIKSQVKKACLLLVVSVVFAGPWMIYSNLHRPSEAQKSEVNSYIMVPYTEQFWDRTAGSSSSGKIAFTELPNRIVENLSTIVLSDIGAVVAPAFFPALNQGLAERLTTYQILISLIISLLVLLGYVQCVRHKMTIVEVAFPLYLTIVILWPFPPYRFLLPLTPFLLLYLIEGVKFFLKLHLFNSQSNSQASPNHQHKQDLNTGLIAVTVILFLTTMGGNVNYIIRKNSKVESELPKWKKVFNETQSVLDWVRVNVPSSYHITTENPALVHLYTGHRTVTYDQPQQNWDLWKSLRVRYYVSTAVIPNVVDQTQSRFYVAYRTNGRLKLPVTDLGPVEIRKPWEYRKSNQMRQN
jgi:hypothetical protein